MLTTRKLSILGFVICAAVLLGAEYLEKAYSISPCPMCMLQRIVYLFLVCIFLVGMIFTIKSFWRYLYTCFVFIFSAIGFAIASKQFWLQNFAPKQHASCSAGLERLIETYPFLDAMHIALNGSPDCAKVDFTFLTISLAGWSMIVFGVIAILSVYAMAKRFKN